MSFAPVTRFLAYFFAVGVSKTLVIFEPLVATPHYSSLCAMDFPRHWGTGSCNDQPFMVIVTQWWVTNASGSGTPVRVLKARPLGSLAKSFIGADVMGEGGNTPLEGVTISEGDTRALKFSADSQKFPSQKRR